MVEVNKHTGTINHMAYTDFLLRVQSLGLIVAHVLKSLEVNKYYDAPHAWFRE